MLFSFLFFILLYVWETYHPTTVSYAREELIFIVITYTVFQLLLVKIEEDRRLEFFERSDFENFFYVKKRSLVNSMMFLSTFNMYIFLFYLGYKTVWYYPLCLFFLGAYICGWFFMPILKRLRKIKIIVTLLQFFILPIFGVLLWCFV